MPPTDHFASALLLALLKAYWPLLLLLALISAGKLAWEIWQQKRLAASGLADIDGMDGQTFEKYLEALFLRLGYQVERTRYVGDYGADLVAVKGGTRLVVQAKRYKKKVGVKAVQEAVAAKGMYRCTEAMVVTNSRFTEQAKTLAKANGVLLHDREWLITQMLALKQEKAKQEKAKQDKAKTEKSQAGVLQPPAPHSPPLPVSAPLSVSPPPLAALSQEVPVSQDVPVCVLCGKEVSEKVAMFCRQHPGRFGTQVYCFNHQRQNDDKA